MVIKVVVVILHLIIHKKRSYCIDKGHTVLVANFIMELIVYIANY